MRSTPSRLILATLFTFAFSLFAFAPAHAANPGDLVKLADDGNLETTADSAVYYVGADNKRYAFPNSQTYFTWYADFSTVKIISATDLAALQLAGNITYRPGTRLVKITSDPNVYAVEPGGSLRWVQTEAVATGLFGNEWNKRIDDIPDAFFFNYSTGSPLAAAVYPTGTVVKRTTDNVYFRIEGGTKRKIASDAVRAALRVQDAFVISTASTLAEYPDGAEITNAEPTITDTAQKTVIALPSIPTFTVKVPATLFFAVGGEAALIDLRIASLKAATIKRITVKVEATTNNPADAGLDDDKGGLVYQNNARPNFTMLRFKDEGGMEPFGRKDIAVNLAQDQSQTFVFDGTYAIPAGTEKPLTLVANVDTLLPSSEGYKVTVIMSGTQVVDGSTGTATAFAPNDDLVGPTLLSLNSSMELLPSATPGNKTYVRGATGAEISGIIFKATTVAPNVVKSLTLQGYVDEEGTGGFLPGADTDNGSETRVRDVVPSVSLYDKDGVKIAGPVNVDLNGKAAFTGLNISIPAGTTKTVVVRSDLSKTVELENAPNKVAFDVTDPAADVYATDDKGMKILVTGANPNGGASPTYSATIKKRGTLIWTWAGVGGNAIAGREFQIGTLSVDAKDDSFDLKTLNFKQVGTPAQSIGGLRIEYPTSASTTASASKQFVGNDATFTNLPVLLEKDKKTDIKVFAVLVQRDAGAQYGQQIKIQLDTVGALEFKSKADDETYDASDLVIGSVGDFTVPTNTVSSAYVRFSTVTAAKDAAQPSGVLFRSSTTEVLKLTLKAESEGAVRVKKLTFKLVPADAGREGADNDALEKWSDINGDFNDDDGIINLVQVIGTSRNVIAEGSAAQISYSIMRGSTKITSPSTGNSMAGDYGLIEILFPEGSELSVPAGMTQKFVLELDTTQFSPVQDYALTVDLLGAGDFLWTDVPSGAYTALTGTDMLGLPLSNGVTVKQ